MSRKPLASTVWTYFHYAISSCLMYLPVSNSYSTLTQGNCQQIKFPTSKETKCQLLRPICAGLYQKPIENLILSITLLASVFTKTHKNHTPIKLKWNTNLSISLKYKTKLTWWMIVLFSCLTKIIIGNLSSQKGQQCFWWLVSSEKMAKIQSGVDMVKVTHSPIH